MTVVTGAEGFIGARLVRLLRSRGYETLSWTRSEGDLRDTALVAENLKQIEPGLIFHCAGSLPGADGGSWGAVGDDARMLTNLATAMPRDARLVFTGSMAEYGRSGYLNELDPCHPGSSYGFAKLSATNSALALRVTHGLDIRVARLFGVYGPGEAPQRLIPHLLARLATGQPIPLSDGGQVRDFVHVNDVCACLIRLAATAHLPFPIVNIGTGVGLSVREVCETVAATIGADPGLLQFGKIPRRAVDEDCLVAQIGRLATLGSVPPQRLRAGAESKSLFTSDGQWVVDFAQHSP